MKILGFDLTRNKADSANIEKAAQLVDTRGGFFDFIRDSFTGAWQKNVVVDRQSVLAYFAVFSCMSLISADMGKLRPKLMKNKGGIPTEFFDDPITKILKKPNKYQNWQKFAEQYVLSKLSNGNTYVLKTRDSKGKITELHVLNPSLCKVYVTQEGDVYYQAYNDSLARLGYKEEDFYFPASEIIHDTMVCLFHPLVGVSPIYACGLAATQGLSIQNNSTLFFNNMSRPSGMLTAPAKINDDTAARLKKAWEDNFSGGSIGKLAVLGDGLKYEAMTINAADSQMLEQLKWTAETVCSCFHVPAYKIGVGAIPTYNNAEVLNQIYYTDCLQSIIQSMEGHLEYGLELSEGVSIELELDGLLRMDTATQIKSLNDSVSGGWMSPNEARYKRNMPPVKGGESPYMQQQNYSLEALAERDKNSPLMNTNNQSQQTATVADTTAADQAAKSFIEQLMQKTKELFVLDDEES